MQWMWSVTGHGASHCSSHQQLPGTTAFLDHSGALETCLHLRTADTGALGTCFTKQVENHDLSARLLAFSTSSPAVHQQDEEHEFTPCLSSTGTLQVLCCRSCCLASWPSRSSAKPQTVTLSWRLCACAGEKQLTWLELFPFQPVAHFPHSLCVIPPSGKLMTFSEYLDTS